LANIIILIIPPISKISNCVGGKPVGMIIIICGLNKVTKMKTIDTNGVKIKIKRLIIYNLLNFIDIMLIDVKTKRI